jgi:curved DNA-binding protein CbpA
MAGQLKINPLPELIREISAAELSGALRLTRERAKAVVYFNAGEIIYAASNLRAFRLVESARRWNILSEQQLAEIQGKPSDLELGTTLVETGTLSREKLDAMLERQVSELLLHTLLWTEGEWEFDPRVRITFDVRLSIKTKKLLTESARHLPVEFVSERFKAKDERLSPDPEAPADFNLLPNEAFVMTRVYTPLSVDELLAISGLPEAETLKVIYTLSLGGFLRRSKWPEALTAEMIAKARAVKTATTAEQATPVETILKAEQKSAPTPPATTAAPPSQSEEMHDEQSEINALFAKVRLTPDHYQMLGVRRTASASDIKRAYYALAKRFHPDRFRRDTDDEQLARIQSAFAQIAQAYDTLKDQTTRAGYDSKLLKQEAAQRGSRASTPPRHDVTNQGREVSKAGNEAKAPSAGQQPGPNDFKVEEKFQQGLSALQKGDSVSAIAALGEAARLAPSEPRYRAHFGQALASQANLRHSAEAELKAAIALDAGNAAYRVMLAELYAKIGLLKRAQGELSRVLADDPKNEAARRLLDKLKR